MKRFNREEHLKVGMVSSPGSCATIQRRPLMVSRLRKLSHSLYECKYHGIVLSKVSLSDFLWKPWAIGYCISTIGLDEEKILESIHHALGWANVREKAWAPYPRPCGTVVHQACTQTVSMVAIIIAWRWQLVSCSIN